MLQFFREMMLNAGVARDLLAFLWRRRLWWLIPMVVVLMAMGLIMVFAASSGVGPFIYTLF